MSENLLKNWKDVYKFGHLSESQVKRLLKEATLAERARIRGIIKEEKVLHTAQNTCGCSQDCIPDAREILIDNLLLKLQDT